MNLKILVLLCPFLIVSCNKAIQSQDIIYKDYRYYHKNKLINGEREIFENQYKSIFNFKDGIPQGKWAEYGIKNEIILEGNIKHLLFNGYDGNIKRVFYNSIVEGQIVSYNNIVIIYNDSLNVSSPHLLDNICKIIKDTLLKSELDTIYEFQFKKGELEKVDYVIRNDSLK